MLDYNNKLVVGVKTTFYQLHYYQHNMKSLYKGIETVGGIKLKRIELLRHVIRPLTS